MILSGLRRSGHVTWAEGIQNPYKFVRKYFAKPKVRLQEHMKAGLKIGD
jgi:hypothetical protein